jgi:hypothetical protein
MVIGFEEYTASLSEGEVLMAEWLATKLPTFIGKQKAVSNHRLRWMLFDTFGNIPPARVRKLINYIRINCLVENLIANSAGYYVAETHEEVDAYVQSLRQRAASILHVAQSFN